jgi:C-terminal processing protease CtpA/Prc
MAQMLFPLTDGSGFTLTTGVLKTGAGKVFNISGLTPDYAMKDTGIAGQPNDPGLQRAMAVLDQAPLATAQARS